VRGAIEAMTPRWKAGMRSCKMKKMFIYQFIIDDLLLSPNFHILPVV